MYAFYTYLANSVVKNTKICYNQDIKDRSGGDFMKRFDIYNGKSVAVKKEQRCKGHDEVEHTHEFVELVYTTKGNFTHYINGYAYPTARGDLLFINYGEVHSFTVDNDESEFYNFSVKPEFMSENIVNSENVNDIFLLFLPEGSEELQKRKTSCVRFVGDERMEIESIAAKMCEELDEKKSKRPCHNFVLNAYMRLIFAKLIRALLDEVGDQRPNLLTDEVVKYIDENFTSPVSAAALADHCFYNPAYLGRVFKAVYGKSMKEYIREKRLAYAMELLRTTSLSVEEISAKVGYSSKAQFYKNFKELYGKAPGEFKKP